MQHFTKHTTEAVQESGRQHTVQIYILKSANKPEMSNIATRYLQKIRFYNNLNVIFFIVYGCV